MTTHHSTHHHRCINRLAALGLVVANAVLAFTASAQPSPQPSFTPQQHDPILGNHQHPERPLTARIATWNIQTVGPPGSQQFDAAAEVLRRTGPDVVALQEIDGGADVVNLITLANQLGYTEVVIASPSPFGQLRNAIISKHPVLSERIISSENTSGDPNANDITRYFVEAVVQIAPAAEPVAIISGHWKSGFGDDNEFRRAVESYRVRVGALAMHDPLEIPVFVAGDVNEDVGDPPLFPSTFFSLPSGLPGSYVLGADARAIMQSTGIINSPFHELTNQSTLGLTLLPALQLDGLDATRPASGRRLDYLFYSAAITTPPMAEVYDSLDESIGGGLPKFDPPPPSPSVPPPPTTSWSSPTSSSPSSATPTAPPPSARASSTSSTSSVSRTPSPPPTPTPATATPSPAPRSATSSTSSASRTPSPPAAPRRSFF